MSGQQTNLEFPDPNSKHRHFQVESCFTATLFAVQHGLTTGTGPLAVSCSGGEMPGGLAVGTDYWAIGVRELGLHTQDPDRFQLATSPQNARDGIAIDLTTPGTGYFLIGPR